LATELARTLIEPLRERLVAAIDTAHEPGETSAQVAERIGARYREWKNRAAEGSSDDVLVAAYSRGHYDAAADGTHLTSPTLTARTTRWSRPRRVRPSRPASSIRPRTQAAAAA